VAVNWANEARSAVWGTRASPRGHGHGGHRGERPAPTGPLPAERLDAGGQKGGREGTDGPVGGHQIAERVGIGADESEPGPGGHEDREHECPQRPDPAQRGQTDGRVDAAGGQGEGPPVQIAPSVGGHVREPLPQRSRDIAAGVSLKRLGADHPPQPGQGGGLTEIEGRVGERAQRQVHVGREPDRHEPPHPQQGAQAPGDPDAGQGRRSGGKHQQRQEVVVRQAEAEPERPHVQRAQVVDRRGALDGDELLERESNEGCLQRVHLRAIRLKPPPP
jgi:hypothetical protein